MGERNRWWAVLIALGMVAYGGAVLWPLFSSQDRRVSQWDPVIVAILIAGVGAYALVMELKYQPEDRARSFLWEAIQPYAAAWSKLWRTKWLLWIYGTVVVVVATGNVFGSAIFAWLRRGQSATYGDVSQLGFAARVLNDAWMSLPFWSWGVLHKFFPTIVRASWDPVFDVVALLLALSILPAVLRLRRDPEYAKKAGFFALCLAVFGVACLVSGAVWMQGVCHYADRVRLPQASTAQMFTNAIAQIAAGTIFSAVLIGGILGSLFRDKKGDAVDRSTFLADAVKHFEPMAGIILICALPALLSFLTRIPYLQVFGFVYAVLGTLLAPLLMFAPFAVAVQGANCWDAILRSVQVWKTTVWRTIPLIAIGAFFFALVSAPRWMLQFAVSKVSWLHVGMEPVYTLFSVVPNALILLAVWEFYSANVPQPEHALDEQA
jgi:hypothetical protein